MSVKIHPTAIVEDGVTLGDGTSVWDNVHICKVGTILLCRPLKKIFDVETLSFSFTAPFKK